MIPNPRHCPERAGGHDGGEFNVQMAGSLILALPVLVLYIFMGKYLISGQMSGAVTAS